MNGQTQQQKALGAFMNRVQGFLDDGYYIISDYLSQEKCSYSLIHDNGKQVTLTLYPGAKRIEQHSNGKLVTIITLLQS